MTINWKKSGTIVLLYYLMVFLQACCNCPDPELPYFDYKAISIENYEAGTLSAETEFGFTFRFSSVEYLALQRQGYKSDWGLMNKAYACDCPAGVGNMGPKFKIAAINIYADSVFDSSIPKGAPLNDLFEITNYYYNTAAGKYENIPLNSFKEHRQYYTSDFAISLVSKSVPVALNRPYNFTIEIVKENGTVVRSTTSPMVWEE